MITGFIALDNGKPVINSVRDNEEDVMEFIGYQFSYAYGEGWAIAEEIGYTIKPCVVMV